MKVTSAVPVVVAALSAEVALTAPVAHEVCSTHEDRFLEMERLMLTGVSTLGIYW